MKKLVFTVLLVTMLALSVSGTAIAAPAPQANGSGTIDLSAYGNGEFDFNFHARQVDPVTETATGKIRLTWDTDEFQVSLNGEIRYMAIGDNNAWIGFVVDNGGLVESYIIEIEDGETDFISAPFMVSSASNARSRPDFSSQGEGTQWFSVSRGNIKIK